MRIKANDDAYYQGDHDGTNSNSTATLWSRDMLSYLIFQHVAVEIKLALLLPWSVHISPTALVQKITNMTNMRHGAGFPVEIILNADFFFFRLKY